MSTTACEIVTSSAEETLSLGARIAQCLCGGMTLALVGPLGAGKTLLVRGIATQNAGGPCEVSSPTFTLIQEYPGRLTLYHLDVYRLSKPNDPLLLGLDEMTRPDSVVIIEWADRVRHALGGDTLWVEIEPVGESARRFRFAAAGPLPGAVIESVRASCVDTSAAQT